MVVTKTMKKLSNEMKNNRYGWGFVCPYCYKNFIYKDSQIIESHDMVEKVMCPYCYSLLRTDGRNYG